jgi:hypothetical protein
MSPPPTERVDLGDGRRVDVVRDDRVEGGTKAAVLRPLLERRGRETVYASPAEGFGQVAIALAARDVGVPATIFVAARRERHASTTASARAGAAIREVRPGYLAVVSARAREYAAERDAFLLPLGLDAPEIVAAIRDRALALAGPEPTEVWSVAGSGVLTRGLQAAWPEATVYAVRVGRELRGEEAGSAYILRAPEAFSEPAEEPPPFPSHPTYDAKAWRFVRRHASDGALLWNVA